jgi:CubicO group peptidase (beta-lactamase class C family)
MKLISRSKLASALIIGSTVFGANNSAWPASADWQTASPEHVGLAPDIGTQLDQAFASGKLANVHGVVLIRQGKLILERYQNGNDEKWGLRKDGVVFGPTTKHDIRSITKSVVSLLYGIALEEGKVPSVDQPLVDSFPEYVDLASDPQRRRMTVGHALTMTLGTEWDEDRPYTDPLNSEIAMDRAADSYRYALDRPFVTEPGKQWNYNGGTATLLARMIARGTATDLTTYAEQRLFAPLGIEDFEWVKGYYGEPVAASGLRLRPRDLAKIGQLVLTGGLWDGAQIIPADWLAESHQPRAEVPAYETQYGYLWWLDELDGGRKVIEGAGNGGQELLIVPDLDLVLVVTAGNYNNPDAWKPAWALLTDTVIPAVRSP